MTPQRWQRIQEIFCAALAQSSESRMAYLRDACGSDLRLRDQVEAMLTADAGDDRFLNFSPRFLRPSLDCEDLVDRRLGAYVIRRRLAVGGMGSVWLAERDDDQFRGQAAIKIIKRGLDTDELLRRFRRERQVLANLHHPHISRLLDGGATADGRPYLIMEYVDGVPIDRYCDEHLLSIRDRLELFRKVCSAVQVAHQNLIVHRDLKPGNILVSENCEPTLLDFGIAKVLNENEAGYTQQTTNADQRLLTPIYASPEQIRGEFITTATDIYSLGVILYELLTGTRPNRVGSESLRAMEAATCEQEPVRPSETIRQDLKWIEVRRARRHLRGDLDNIVLKALRKEPERRYSSVEQFSDDIRRHLDGQPVLARPDTFVYRTGKFVRRNRLTVGLTAAVFFAVAALAISMTTQSIRVARERNKAIEAGRLAKETQQFLENMLASITPEQARGRDTVLLRGILDQASKRVETISDMDPQLKGHLHEMIADVYIKIGFNDAAKRHAQLALRIRRRLGSAENVDLAQCLLLMARIERNAHRPVEVEQLCRESLAIYRQAFGECHPQVAHAMDMLATALFLKGQTLEAEQLYRKTLDMRRQTLGESDAVADSLNNLAGVLLDRGAYAESLQMFQESVTLWRKIRGSDDRWIGVGLTNQAICLMQLRDFAAAEATCREALESILASKRELHALWTRTILGTILMTRGDYAGAIDVYRAALDERRRVVQSDDADLAGLLHNLGIALAAYGDIETSGVYLEQALAMMRGLFDEADVNLSIATRSLALCRKYQDRREEAESLLIEALARQLPPNPGAEQEAAITLTAFGSLYVSLGESNSAEAVFCMALSMLQREGSSLTVDAASAEAAALNGMAEIRLQQGNLSAARECVEVALTRQCAYLDDDHPEMGPTLMNLGRLSRAEGDRWSAEAMFHKALALRRAHMLPNHPDIASTAAELETLELISVGQ